MDTHQKLSKEVSKAENFSGYRSKLDGLNHDITNIGKKVGFKATPGDPRIFKYNSRSVGKRKYTANMKKVEKFVKGIKGRDAENKLKMVNQGLKDAIKNLGDVGHLLG